MRISIESYPFLVNKGKNDSVALLFDESSKRLYDALNNIAELEKGTIYKIKLSFEVKEEK